MLVLDSLKSDYKTKSYQTLLTNRNKADCAGFNNRYKVENMLIKLT